MSRSAPSEIDVRQLGQVPFDEAYALQQQLRDARLAGESQDCVLLLEHPDVITLGRKASRDPQRASLRIDEAELRSAGYAVAYVNRGGDVTYHGPGQLVGYPILDLAARGRDVHGYLRILEAVLIDTAADFGVSALRREGYTGVWLDARHKLASIGIGLRRWVTLHGFALNVCISVERSRAIVPCGLSGVEMVNLADVAPGAVPMHGVRERVAAHLRKAFG